MKASTKRERPRPAPVPPDAMLGRYRIRGLIDEGGMARVYLAHDPELDRSVALKVIENVGIVSNQAREWMLNEARSLARLDHPGIVRVLDVESDGVHDFIVMEHVPGPSLTRVIAEMRRRREGGTTDPDGIPPTVEVQRAADALETYTARAELLREIAEALAWAHDRGVLHRDIKPGNVLIDANGAARLIDFGLAHIEEQASAVGATAKLYGTAEYIAPEQVDQQRAGAEPATDQYSLGVLMFELLTLRSPFHRRTRALTLDAVSKAAPRRPRHFDASVPRDLEAICLHAIEREPENRYPSVARMAQDLAAWLEQRPLSVSATAGHMLRLWARRNRLRLVLAGVVGVLLVLTGAAVWTVQQLEERSTIQQRLAGLDVAGLEQPEEFSEAFLRLREGAARARSFDAGWLRAKMLGRQQERVDELAEALSSRLSKVLTAIKRGRAPSRVDVELVRWLPVLRNDAELCSELPYNIEDRKRGQISLVGLAPTDVEVWRYEPIEGENAHELVRVPFSEMPSRGTYVVTGPPWSGTLVLRQANLLVETEAQPAQELAFREPLPELLDGMIECDRAEYTIPPTDLTPPVVVRIEPYRIMPSPVTWRQFRPFAEEHWEPDRWEMECGDLPPDSPARVTWREAFEFARWAGMRLPSTLEVYQAQGKGEFVFASPPPYSNLTPLPYQGEWIVDPGFAGTRERNALDYAQLSWGAPFPRAWTVPHLPDDVPLRSQKPISDLPFGRKRSEYAFAFRLALTR